MSKKKIELSEDFLSNPEPAASEEFSQSGLTSEDEAMNIILGLTKKARQRPSPADPARTQQPGATRARNGFPFFLTMPLFMTWSMFSMVAWMAKSVSDGSRR